MQETAILEPSNYYGKTKLMGERMLTENFNSVPTMSSISLRYFNVAGRHPSGKLSDDQISHAHSLFSQIEAVLLGKNKFLKVFGDDWDTSDGTCLRDYLHITDLAKAHLDALKLLDLGRRCIALNLGLGVGQSVYDVISTYERVAGKSIPRQVTKRRAGDVGISYADTRLAVQLIGWRPAKTLVDICMDSFAAVPCKEAVLHQ
jgi:UDP-glucose 4-epimerase